MAIRARDLEILRFQGPLHLAVKPITCREPSHEEYVLSSIFQSNYFLVQMFQRTEIGWSLLMSWFLTDWMIQETEGSKNVAIADLIRTR